MALSELPLLEGPYEFLEVVEGQPVTFHPIQWELGRAQTQPPWLPAGTLVWYEVLRMHLPRTEKPLFPYYFDVGQKTLVPQLRAVLPQATLQGVGITIAAVGSGPKKRFSVGLEVAQGV